MSVTRENHIQWLETIRDEAMGDPKTLRVALAAEIARGQAAGLYNTAIVQENEHGKIEDQSTVSIKKQLEGKGIDISAIPVAEFTEIPEPEDETF